MDKKSRFSRYRTRIRERKQLDTMEMMTTDVLNNAPYVCSYILLTFLLFELILLNPAPLHNKRSRVF